MNPRFALLLLALVLFPPASAGQEPPEPEPAAAGVEETAAEPAAQTPEREVADPEARLAELDRRCHEAEARARAGDLALSGALPYQEAFPELARAPLDSIAWVTGRLDELDRRGKAYAAERRTNRPPAETTAEDEAGGGETPEGRTPNGRTPGGQAPDDAERLRAAGDAAHRALMKADEMERRFLLAVLVHLEENPQLRRPNLAEKRLELAVQVDAAEAAFARAEDSAAEQRAREVVIAQRQVERLEELLRGLMLHFTVGAPLPEPGADVDLLEDPVRAEGAEFRLGLLLPFLGGAERPAVTEALARRQQAKAEAAEARAAAESREQSVAARHAEMHNAAAVAGQDAKDAEARLGQRQRELQNVRAGLRGRLDESREKAAAIAERSARGEQPRQAADALYGELRELEGDVLNAIGDAGKSSIEADRALALAQSDAARAGAEIERYEGDVAAGTAAPLVEVLDGWRGDLEGRLGSARELAGLEQGHRDQVSALLKEARDLRRGLRGEVSFGVMRKDLFDDLLTEATLVGPNMLALAEHRWSTVLELPSKVKDLKLAGALLVQTFWVLFVVAGVLIARRQTPRTVGGLLRRLTAGSRRYLPRDLRAMARPAERTLKALVDLAAGALLLWLLADTLPELGLLCLIYLQVALYRAVVGLTALAVAAHPEVRPALVTLEPMAREMTLLSVRVLVLWLIARWLSRFSATRILAALTLDEVLRIGFNVLLAAIVVWLLHRWEPVLRDALQRRDPTHRLVLLLTRRRLQPLAALKTVAQAVAYLGIWIRDLLSHHVLRKTATGEAGTAARLPGEFVAQLLRRDCPENGFVERPETGQELDQALNRWRSERRRGVAMLLGGQGAGKRTFVDRWCRTLETGDQPVVRARLGERLTNGGQACRWLAKALAIEDPPAEPEALAGRVNAQLKGQVVVLRDLHFAFLRRVDGFSALRFLLAVVGSAHRVFWLLSMHRPSWHYLESLRGWINTEACHQVIELEPFHGTELRRLVEERVASAGHEVGFSRLLPRGARHDADTDPQALERIAAEYFRRLAWVSQGNPAVALNLWRETLVPGQGDGHLEVTRFGQLAALPALRDPDLFLLAAIYTHRAMTEGEIAEVTNMNPAQVGAAVRNLEAWRLLVGRSKRYAIEARYLPAVIAELRQRHFIHGGA